jgi:transposase InsO family protein
VEFIPIRSRSMLDVAKGFATIVSTWGVPDIVITDRGTEFVDVLMRNVREILQYKHIKTTVQNPQANGQAEAVMKTLKNSLAAYVKANQRDWSDYLSLVKLSINGSVNTVTGYTLHFLMTGREMSSPTLERVAAARESQTLDDYSGRLAEALQYI